MANTRDLLVRINGDASGFEKALGKTTNAAGKSGGKIAGAFDKATGSSQALLLGIGGIGTIFAGTVTAMIAKGGFSRAMNIEDAQGKLKGLGHDTESVQRIMADALNSVKGTAFGLDAAATTAASAVAAGVKPAKDLERYLKLTADAATIAGVDMGEMGRTFNKVQAIGSAYNDSLQVLAEKGIPIYTWLSESMGVSTEAVKELASQGKVSSEDFLRSVEKNISGAALESGKTTRGAWANMQAAMARVGAKIADEVLPRMKDAFVGITVWFDENSASIVGFFNTLLDVSKASFGWMADNAPIVVGAIIGALVPAFVALAGSIWAAVAPLLPFIAAGAAIGFAAKLIIDRMGGVQAVFEKVRPVIEIMMMLWRDHLQPAIMSVWKAFTERLLPSLKRLWDTISPILIPVLKVLGAIIGGLIFANIMIFVKGLQLGISWLSNIINWISNVIQWIKNLVGWFAGIGSAIGSGMSNVKDKLTQPFKSAFNAIANLWNNTVGQLSFTIPDWVPGLGNKGFSMPKIPTFQKGVQNFEGGLAYVHKGEILANLPPGTDVVSAARSQNLLQNSGAAQPQTVLNFNPTLQVGMFAGMPTEYREVAERMWVEFMRIAKSNGINLENIGARVQG